ncbi:MAG: helix-hairpin-helix domain-containing protein [Thermoanaerobacteraceae bacterium]|nr:helix-hairpin-helix domain-containing protein [Thermoanaerobacteraceae bacterium]
MNFKKMQSFILIAIIILAAIGSIIFYLKDGANEVEVVTSAENNRDVEIINNDIPAIPEDENQPQVEIKTVFVHVAGQVKNPGVYELKNGLRVIDAVNMAGGPLQDADLDSLNLAKKLSDEEKIYVPKKGEMPPASNNVPNSAVQSSTAINGKININTAGIEELKSLPGIGDVLARNIIDYRNANGPFNKIEDIVNVPKIGPKTFENIKDKITI